MHNIVDHFIFIFFNRTLLLILVGLYVIVHNTVDHFIFLIFFNRSLLP